MYSNNNRNNNNNSGIMVMAQTPATEPSTINYTVAGILDTTNLPWAQDVWEFTFDAIYQPWFQELIPALQEQQGLTTNTVSFSHPLQNAACDPTTAVREYWSLRSNVLPPNAVIGCYCSGATLSLARIAGLDQVSVVSPFSTSVQLSDTSEFPYFGRLLAPDDARGEVGALVASLQMFGWNRVSVLATDSQYAKDWEREFRHIWTTQVGGEVAYSNTIRTEIDGTLDVQSAIQALLDIPTDDPRINARVIVLAAHFQHAFPILKLAQEMAIQPDTIWAGTSSWVGNDLTEEEQSWMPDNAGFLGAVPFKNEDGLVHQTFLEQLRQQRATSTRSWMSFPTFAPQLIDSIVAMVISLSRGGTIIDGQTTFNTFRSLEFDGVSGKVHFTAEGDLKNPQYTILQRRRWSWKAIGRTGTQVGSAEAAEDARFCFPQNGCVTSLANVPSDSYPVPRTKLPVGAVVSIVLALLAVLVLAFKYWRSHRSKESLKKEFEAFQESIVGMRTAQTIYIPTPTCTIATEDDVEQPKPGRLGGAKTTLTVQPQAKIVWCWQETASCIGQHEKDMIEGNPADCWIKYSEECNDLLEGAYQKGDKKCKVMKGYVVDFRSMKQTKKKTGFERAVQRVVVDPLSSTYSSATSSAVGGSSVKEHVQPKTVDLTKARFGDDMPSDIRNEPQMVLIEGDIVQVSEHQDGWAFGTKLHHQDEAVARELVAYVVGDSGDEANILADTGWFPLDATDLPSADDLKVLEQAVGGDAGALEAPSHWDPVKNPTIAELHRLKQSDPEYTTVVNAFRSTLRNRTITSINVDRIQNLAMWQSYVVKRRTICVRDVSEKKKQKGNKNDGDDGALEATRLHKAMERFERCWLWHGTNAEVKEKIFQQGFNRSFCGKNATMYGKGVYFARDASYASYRTYTVPDPAHGNRQYVMACRVVVGEYCQGTKDAVTPRVRDDKSQSLSTRLSDFSPTISWPTHRFTLLITTPRPIPSI